MSTQFETAGADDQPAPTSQAPVSPSWFTPRRARWLVLGVALYAVVSVTVAAWEQDWTFDERDHLEYARQIMAHRPATRHSVFNSKTPAMLPNALLERAAIAAQVTDARALRLVARLPSIGVFLALLAAVFAFTRRRSTALAAWAAVLACTLDPNLLAHSGLTCVDALFALASFLAVWSMVAFVRRGDATATILLGLALGLAVTVKFTGLYLVPAFLSLPFLSGARGRPDRHEVVRRCGWLILASGLACLVVSASYFFHDVGKPLSAFRFETPIFRWAAHALGALRLPLPADFLTGVDMVTHLERGKFNVVILDRWYDDGTWYYFFVLGLLKTPLAVLVGCGVALWLGLRSGAYRRAGLGLLVMQSILYVVYFSFVFRGQLGYRYVIMVLPVIYVLAAIGAAPVLARPGAGHVVLGLTLVATLELLPFFGHPLAFSNALVLPKRDAFRYLADSNLYWNEYHDQIPDLVRRHGLTATINPPHVLPGTVVFDANVLSGVLWNFEQHRWARRNLSTAGHIRHVLFIYEVTPDDFGRFLEANRKRPPFPSALPCPGTARVPAFTSSGVPAGEAVCIDAEEVADVSVFGLSGSARVGLLGADGLCRAEPFRARQEIWYRLEQGRHAICTADADGFSGRWSVRRGNAAFLIPDAGRELPRDSPRPR